MREEKIISEEERFRVRTAWLYHIEGMTQNAIAEHLGVTRLRVNRAIQDAQQDGVVRISIHSRFAPCLELEKALKQTFGLKDAVVSPAPIEDRNAVKIVGTELGLYLYNFLRLKSTKLLGVGWGETLNYAVRTIKPGNRPDLEIISAFGTLPRGSGFNSFGVATRLATAFSANCTYLPLPLYSSSKESRDIILVQEVFQEVFEKIHIADGIVVSAGDMTPRSLLIRDGVPGDIDVNELIEAGAVGDILGYFLNEDGKIIDHPISDRALGLNPLGYRGKGNTILAAGGEYKKRIILAALKSGIFDTLITEERAAKSVLKMMAS